MARAVTGAEEGVIFNQDVWYEMEFLLNHYESILYCRANEGAISGLILHHHQHKGSRSRGEDFSQSDKHGYHDNGHS